MEGVQRKKRLCFFGYLGGKQYLLKHLLKLIPLHRVYCEPFGGAASLLLNKPFSEVEVYNDKCGDLVNLFLAVRDSPEEFLEKFKFLVYSRKLHDEWRKELKSNEASIDPVEQAARFLYILLTSYAGDFNGGWQISRTKPRKFVIEEETLKKIHERLKNVYIECDDFTRVIPRWDGVDTFFYLDPPYIGTENNFYDLTEQEHCNLAELLRSVKGKWLLTYNDHLLIYKLYKGFKISKVSVAAVASKVKNGKRGRIRHLIIRNY
ncbi:MAG: DNA adenine methylase [Candidatus Bathyarchaeia archaeon]